MLHFSRNHVHIPLTSCVHLFLQTLSQLKAHSFLSIPVTAFTDEGKFLLAARRYKNGARTEYIISLDPKDLSQGSKAYVGKLRLGFPSGNSGHPDNLSLLAGPTLIYQFISWAAL